MGQSATELPMRSAPRHPQAIRLLVESALRKVTATRLGELPRNRREWIDRLCGALISESETGYHATIASLMATGVGSDEFFQTFVPEAAFRLGELWLKDEASFVDVTVGAGRLQALYRDRPEPEGNAGSGLIPLGQSFLMVVPAFEDHSLGAFAAADRMRRHGVWVQMAIRPSNADLLGLVATRRFAAIGFTAATWKTVEKLAELVDYLRTKSADVPPIVIGGRAVAESNVVRARTGADFVVGTAREAIERCGLANLGSGLVSELLG